MIKSIPYPDIDPQQGLIWYYKNTGVNGRTLFGHNGGDIGVTTEMFISISDDIGVIVLTNSSNYNAIIQIERYGPSLVMERWILPKRQILQYLVILMLMA